MRVLVCFVLLGLLIAGCNQTSQDQTNQRSDIDVTAILEMSGQPSDTNRLILIDGETNNVYAIEPSQGIQSASTASNVTVTLMDDVIFEQTKESENTEQIEALAATCPSGAGPYYKNVFQGATGFIFDAAIPSTSNYGGQSHNIYGGYSAGIDNIEVGLQHDKEANTQWQLYFRISESGVSDPLAIDGYIPEGKNIAHGWEMTRIFYNPGTTVNFRSESVIGSDTKHYVKTIVKQGTTTTTVFYTPAGASAVFKLTDLQPSKINSIEVRKVVSIATPTSSTGISGAKIVNAKFRNSQVLKNGVASPWTSSTCKNEFGGKFIITSTTVTQGEDVSIVPPSTSYTLPTSTSIITSWKVPASTSIKLTNTGGTQISYALGTVTYKNILGGSFTPPQPLVAATGSGTLQTGKIGTITFNGTCIEPFFTLEFDPVYYADVQVKITDPVATTTKIVRVGLVCSGARGYFPVNTVSYCDDRAGTPPSEDVYYYRYTERFPMPDEGSTTVDVPGGTCTAPSFATAKSNALARQNPGGSYYWLGAYAGKDSVLMANPTPPVLREGN